MCYSYRTSLISYTLGMLSAIFAFATRQYILGTLILFYCQMQLSEAIIWKGIDENNLDMNRKGTKYGKYLLPTHLFAVGLGFAISVYLLKNVNVLRKPIYLLPMFLGVVFYILILYGPYKYGKVSETTFPADTTCMNNAESQDEAQRCQTRENRLKWPYPHTWYIFGFALCLVFLILFTRPLNSQIFIGGMFTVSFILSALIYPNSVGSFWCFSAAILAPLLVLGNWYIIHDMPNRNITV